MNKAFKISFFSACLYLLCLRSPNAEIEKQWSPEGYSWYGDELIADRPSRYTLEEQSQILDNHPFFTGVCPQCRHRFDRDNLPVHYDCPECEWMDESIN